MKYAPKEDRAHQAYMLDTELADATSLNNRQDRGVGRDDGRPVESCSTTTCSSSTRCHTHSTIKTAFTTTFLERTYDGNKLRWP